MKTRGVYEAGLQDITNYVAFNFLVTKYNSKIQTIQRKNIT